MKTMEILLESERLIYRKLTMDDLPWLIEMRTPEPVARYMGGSKWQNPEALATRLKFYIECYEKFGVGMCGIVIRDTGEMIGTGGLQPLEDTGEIEVGYALSEKHWRHGYGYECAYAWLTYGFEKMGLERIVAVANPDNTGSWRIMEKCGMKYERTADHYDQETVFYGISRTEFMRPGLQDVSIRLG